MIFNKLFSCISKFLYDFFNVLKEPREINCVDSYYRTFSIGNESDIENFFYEIGIKKRLEKILCLSEFLGYDICYCCLNFLSKSETYILYRYLINEFLKLVATKKYVKLV